MEKRAISAFPKRVEMCIAANGGSSKHHRLDPEMKKSPIADGPDGEESEED